jgi:K+-sensing histidine kinase KdpD
MGNMSRFVLGLVIGCFAGAVGTLLLLLVVYNIPDGDQLGPTIPERWRGAGLIVVLMIVSGVLFAFLNLRRVAFATSVLLLLVFVVAHVRGMLASWMALAIAALALGLILPPVHTLAITDPQDQILLGFFILCGAVGTRLIAQNQRA